MAYNTGKPWHKITFDSYLPGTAKVSRQRARIPGQWVVFDKDLGEYIYGTSRALFASGNIEECHAWIEAIMTPRSRPCPGE